jgi:hypothetical protein
MQSGGTERVRGAVRAFATVMLLSLSTPAAFGFNFARYVATDLDTLLAQPRPHKGVDLHPALPLKLTVTLAGYGEVCPTGLLRRAMTMSGVPKDQVDVVKVTTCLNIRSASGNALRVFIQDGIAAYLPKEVALGGTLTLYAVHLFTDTDGPGLLVNEFKTGEQGGTRKSAATAADRRAFADNAARRGAE